MRLSSVFSRFQLQLPWQCVQCQQQRCCEQQQLQQQQWPGARLDEDFMLRVERPRERRENEQRIVNTPVKTSLSSNTLLNI